MAVWLLNWWCAQLELNFFLDFLSAASSATASCIEEAALTSGPGGRTAPVCVCSAEGQPRLPFFLSPLFEEGCSTVYFNLPGTVWVSVRVLQVVFGDGRSPFEVLLVRARAGYAVRRQQSSHCGRSVFFMATKRSSLHKPVRVLLSEVTHALTRL